MIGFRPEDSQVTPRILTALMQDSEPLKLMVPDRPAGRAGRDSIPTHPGALAFSKGEPLDKQ